MAVKNRQKQRVSGMPTYSFHDGDTYR